MMHGANFQDYDQAYRSVTGKSGVIPASALKDSEAIPTRQADTRSEPKPQAAAKAQERLRFGDFLRQQQGFAFITCPCGVKLKLPPNLPTNKVQCPRCKTVHTVSQS